MSIRSDAFGSVTLSGRDAEKFENQLTYGKLKPAAQESIQRGVALSQQLQQGGGQLVIKIQPGIRHETKQNRQLQQGG